MSQPPFAKVLVANRGEIAVRVFRTCRHHKIATVAVYSDADRDSIHAAAADESVRIGPAPAIESYLSVPRIIDAARATSADAIHPGYGFLSERPELATACEAAGLTFIGPPADAMEVMGDKNRARAAMEAAGVPVVPGAGPLADAARAHEAAERVGYPVMLKASAGGGGRGMRIVADSAQLGSAFASATREAAAAFGDGSLLLERAIVDARHVEIQIMADAHGNVVHLGERDCSVQRRHQKVIEESPSPSPQMSADVRERMGDVATRAARAVDYRGAGTVEFLFEEGEDGPSFFFLEMNTRLQVEHAVTEAVTGRDLVWDQIRVAAGHPLGYGQDEVRLTGHSIECRVYAEDPIRFVPSPGTISLARWPEGGTVRVDTGFYTGSVVSRHYDSMIAKLVTWGSDREEAIAHMRRAVRDAVVLGIRTNLSLHDRVLSEPDFVAGASVTTRYLERHPEVLEPEPDASEAVSRAAAAAAGVAAARRRGAYGGVGPGSEARGGGSLDPLRRDESAWRRSARWRS